VQPGAVLARGFYTAQVPPHPAFRLCFADTGIPLTQSRRIVGGEILNRPAEKPPAAVSDAEVFLGRQPIVDRAGNLAAYELLFRSGAPRGAGMPEATIATATVINRLFADFDVELVLGQHRGFINFDTELLMSDVMDFLPQDRVVIELLETIEVMPAVLHRVGELRQRGYTLALDDYAGAEANYAELLSNVDIIIEAMAWADSLAVETK
jgi:EAL and modified HD-GYP domain-containing signal transduction protein